MLGNFFNRAYRSWHLFAYCLPLGFGLVLANPPVGLASSLLISAGSANRSTGEVEADYMTTHVFINEVANESVPITVFFDPQTMGVATAEIFSNLNRRDRAALDADGDGIEDGIKPPPGNSIAAGDDKNYYKAYTMQPVSGGYQLTLPAMKCGAYRLTARYRLNSDPPGVYHWYGDEMNLHGVPKRDHAIVISPAKLRDMQLYEANPLTILATGTAPNQRGTFADLGNGLPASKGPRFNLDYVKALGCNALWLQPIHPRGIAGRQTDPATGQPFELGSPYAVKNFFAVMPLMAKAFAPGNTPAANDTAPGRLEAMKEFAAFVKLADSKGVDIMLDAPFNHTAQDAELADNGQSYWGNSSSSATSEIRNVEARFYSRANAYDFRAQGAFNVAIAPDRFDFNGTPPVLGTPPTPPYGKWPDVYDIYFGRYAALVPNVNEFSDYTAEGDWFDYTAGDENSDGSGNGHFDAITQKVWQYFGDCLQFWLTQTGYPQNPSGAALDSSAGIDALRCDFGQGLPPQCWEYINNRTKSRKWNFVFMAESLDGNQVSYRSARHFDALNENLIYALHNATTAGDYRNIYEQRRTSYGLETILLNTSSQDEDNYNDPFQAFLRFAVNSTVNGITMIFPGQEMGLTGTIVPGSASSGTAFGYERYDGGGFGGKSIPQFKTYNSMMPLWNKLNQKDPTALNLENLYAAVGQARNSSAALRGPNRLYLNLQDGTMNGQIFGIAKFQRRNAGAVTNDIVFAFVNLSPASTASTAAGNWFNVNVDADHDGVNDFGILPTHVYNVKNIAAYTGADPHRRDTWLWGASGRTGSDLLQNGIFVQLNGMPADQNGWKTAPYEPQFLKLFDVTPPTH